MKTSGYQNVFIEKDDLKKLVRYEITVNDLTSLSGKLNYCFPEPEPFLSLTDLLAAFERIAEEKLSFPKVQKEWLCFITEHFTRKKRKLLPYFREGNEIPFEGMCSPVGIAGLLVEKLDTVSRRVKWKPARLLDELRLTIENVGKDPLEYEYPVIAMEE